PPRLEITSPHLPHRSFAPGPRVENVPAPVKSPISVQHDVDDDDSHGRRVVLKQALEPRLKHILRVRIVEAGHAKRHVGKGVIVDRKNPLGISLVEPFAQVRFCHIDRVNVVHRLKCTRIDRREPAALKNILARRCHLLGIRNSNGVTVRSSCKIQNFSPDRSGQFKLTGKLRFSTCAPVSRLRFVLSINCSASCRTSCNRPSCSPSGCIGAGNSPSRAGASCTIWTASPVSSLPSISPSLT